MKKNFNKRISAQAGFTLIELLIVMAILGVLAVVVLVMLNPGEKQAEARDAGRISSVAQLGRSLQAFYTSKTYLPDVMNWGNDLVTSGELATFPPAIDYTYNSVSHCTTYVQPNNGTYCYNEDQANGNGALVFAKAESTSYRSRCTAPEEAYFVFSTTDARGGTICNNLDPTVWSNGSRTYLP
jgi:prepilin-type N-terminal cleavage/methylation domain-containing protein